MCHLTHTTIFVVVAALSANAYPALLHQSYGAPKQSGIQQSGSSQLSQGVPTPSLNIQESGSRNVLGTGFGRPCNGDEVRNVLGECVLPEVSRNIFVYAAPKVIPVPRPTPRIPEPELHYNFVFVKTADPAQKNDPIIVPPPQQKTLVYVLNKKQEEDGGKVIQAPYTPVPRPEVFYVNYGEGDNPSLPGGVDLQTALNTAYTQGQNLNFQGQNLGDIIPGSITSPLVNSPINEDSFTLGVVNGGIVNPGVGGIQLAQNQVNNGFAQGGLVQQSGITAVFQSSTPSQGSPSAQNTGSSLGFSSQTPSTTFNV